MTIPEEFKKRVDEAIETYMQTQISEHGKLRGAFNAGATFAYELGVRAAIEKLRSENGKSWALDDAADFYADYLERELLGVSHE